MQRYLLQVRHPARVVHVDAFGKIYQPMTPEDLNRTLILGAWNDPKNEKHFDLLKMEMENACLRMMST